MPNSVSPISLTHAPPAIAAIADGKSPSAHAVASGDDIPSNGRCGPSGIHLQKSGNPLMSSPEVVSFLADRLVTACVNGDLPRVIAAVADGASVNEKGEKPDWGEAVPLVAAVHERHRDIVVWLLSHGADPNGDWVMYDCVRYSTSELLELLIDAGVDVNRLSGVRPPLFQSIANGDDDKMRVLLAAPALDFTTKYDDKVPEEYARFWQEPLPADTIAQEVSRFENPCFLFLLPISLTVLLLTLTGRETNGAGTIAASSFRR